MRKSDDETDDTENIPEAQEVVWSRDTFELKADQEFVKDELITRLTRTQYRVQLLPAMTGWGKTYAFLALAMELYDRFRMKPLIICPATLAHTYKEALKGLGIPFHGIMSYQALSGRRGKLLSGIEGTPSEVRAEASLSHNFLLRDNGDYGPFYPTQEYRKICRDGCFLLFDESQALKNKTSAAHWAAHALISNGLSFDPAKFACLHLSAAMLDGDKAPFYRNMGLALHEKMYQHNVGLDILEWEHFGFGEIYELATQINQAKTEEIMRRHTGFDMYATRIDRKYRLRTDKMEALLNDLYIEIFRDKVAISVVDPVYYNSDGVALKNDLINGFFELEEEEAAECEAAINQLKRAHIINDDGNVDARQTGAMAQIQACLQRLSRAKSPALARNALQDLRNDPTCKVILCIPFIEHQDLVANALMMYNPLMLRGEIKDIAERHKIVAKFNQPNLKHRVLIMTPGVGGVGLSMHDHIEPTAEDMKLLPMFKSPKEAVFKRRTYLIFNFHFLLMFQSAGRCYRNGMRSDNTVICFYASNAPLESVLINTMAKSGNADSIAPPGTGRKFPDQYDIFIENEGPQHANLRLMMEKLKAMSAEQIKKDKKNL